MNEQGYLEYLHEPTSIVFVRLPGSRNRMGSPESECGRLADEGPLHVVELSPFLVAKYEVTQAQWEAAVGENGSFFRAGVGLPEGTDSASLPVDSVRWPDARFFATSVGLALPTEAQWEYACRAGGRGAFAFGAVLSTDDVVFDPEPSDCNAVGEARRTTLPVGSLTPNAFGLYDMHGNVAEWCEDAYDSDFYSSPHAGGLDPVATTSSPDRVIRGGSWASSADDCRTARRDRIVLNARDARIGLRPVWQP